MKYHSVFGSINENIMNYNKMSRLQYNLLDNISWENNSDTLIQFFELFGMIK